MTEKQFFHIFDKIQHSSASNKKYLAQLTQLYQKVSSDEFMALFKQALNQAFTDVSPNSLFVTRILIFSSQFCADMARKEEEDNEPHAFLTAMITYALEYSDSYKVENRYRSSRFVTLVLQNIQNGVLLDQDLCDDIQRVMLQRMGDPKLQIRLQAVSALSRLQDPYNNECPVISTYSEALTDANSNMRKEVLKVIAPCASTFNKIRERILDVDPSVRSAAYHKCGDIGPNSFRIVERHKVMMCGFSEEHETVKSAFRHYLIPKWLTAYNGKYLDFIRALRLSADEDDLALTTHLCTELITFFYTNHPINDLISVIPTTDEKIIANENLSNDIVLYWSVLTSLLRDSNDMEEYLSQILTELTPFCHFIENVILNKAQEKMDEWIFLDYQAMLLNLFEMVEKFDFSDEVGRRAVHTLVHSVLQKYVFNTNLIKKLVAVAFKSSSSIEFFTNDMCQVISEIKEPLLEQPLTQDQCRERDFKMAELRVKINILKEDQADAVVIRDFQRAQLISNELQACEKQLDSLKSEGGEKQRVIHNDNETTCRCLDVLTGVLLIPEINKLTPSLITCKKEFLIPLITTKSEEAHWRVLKCLSLMAIIDEATAKEYSKIICIPLVTYRSIDNYSVPAVIESVRAVTDILRFYNSEIICGDDCGDATASQNTTKRRLYNEDEALTNVNQDYNNMTVSNIFEIFLDMLDDECGEIRVEAARALNDLLLMTSFPMTPTLMSRIILKWYNPLTTQQDNRLQVMLGQLITRYTQLKESIGVIKNSIFPTISSIANAPRNSPLADIDLDNVLHFYTALLNVHEGKEGSKMFALDVCIKISEAFEDKIVPFLIRLLNLLPIIQDEDYGELITRVEMLLENITEKNPKKNLEKFLGKLKGKKDDSTLRTTIEEQSSRTSTDQSSFRNPEGESRRNSASGQMATQKEKENKIPNAQFKRRKKRNTKNLEPVVVMERCDLTKKFENTTLHTIVENSNEMDSFEDGDSTKIETPITSDSSQASQDSRNLKVVTESSESDVSEPSVRKSTRNRKKRIL